MATDGDSGTAEPKIKECKILSNDDDNISDHFAIHLSLDVPQYKQNVDPHKPVQRLYAPSTPRRPKWDDEEYRKEYARELDKVLSRVELQEVNAIQCNPEKYINIFYSDLCSAIHNAADSATETLRKTSHRKRYWWNNSCKIARDRNRLFHKIWVSLGRPTKGEAYTCHKSARKAYKRACKFAVNGRTYDRFHLIDKLASQKKPRQLWNIIRKSRDLNKNLSNAISLEKLESYFSDKFSNKTSNSPVIDQAMHETSRHFTNCDKFLYSEYVFTEYQIKKYIRKLKLGSACGVDRISPEHLKYGLSSDLPVLISYLLTACVRFGAVPDCFTHGLLVPILKKPNSDPTCPKNYRPITVSAVISKLLEYRILEECSGHVFNPSQFGFVPKRGCSMATALAHDLGTYANAQGSTLFFASLDAQGAYDFLPHCVILKKSIGIISDKYWRLLYKWYNSMSVHIRWGSYKGKKIEVKRGTRLGGLTSPFMFNLFYQELIAQLNENNCGITIDGCNFNIVCYADDILLCSLTSSGLQFLIDKADEYIKNHGLNFNPAKTECLLYGSNPFVKQPVWTLDDVSLKIVTSIKYLGTVISFHDRGKYHILSRTAAAQKAYFSLQGAGIKYRGVTPKVSSYIYQIAVTSILSYGCSSIHLSKLDVNVLDRTQSKHIKNMLGLRFSSHTTPLLQGLGVLPISTVVMLDALNLNKSCLISTSSAGMFYKILLSKVSNSAGHGRTLMGRVISFLEDHSLNFVSYLCNANYIDKFKQRLIVPNNVNGVYDSVRTLLNVGYNYSEFSRDVLQMLVNSF